MQSFGERLRHEREARNATIEEISAATGIHRGFLEALEKNEFQSLPGGAFGKFYLRAYAEILDFDPEPLIVHYDRERHRDPPEPIERRPDEPTLRRVEASLAKWRASHGGRKSVGRVVEEPLEDNADDLAEEPQDVEVAAPQPAEPVIEVAEPEHVVDVQQDPEPKPLSVSVLAEPDPPRPHKLAATVGVAVVGLLIAAYLALRPSPAPPAPAPAPAPAVAAPQPLPAAPSVAAPVPAPTKPVAQRPKRVEPPTGPSAYTVSDFGVGLRDRAERMEAPVEPFHEGDVVAFSTRVQGGKAGQSIRHVWLHRGRAVQSIRLRVGAADWRTFSTKTLWGAGPWSVEARDESGQVLARAAFDCERRPR